MDPKDFTDLDPTDLMDLNPTEEIILSDFYCINQPQELNEKINGIPICRIRFNFAICPDDIKVGEISQDSDGDFLVSRRNLRCFTIDSGMKTKIDDVGLQIWNSSLLLCEYLLSFHLDDGKGRVMLELGGGIGVVGIVAAELIGAIVFCTGKIYFLLYLCFIIMLGNLRAELM